MTHKHSGSRLLVLAVLVVLALLLSTSTARAASCSISSFFSFDSNDQITDVVHIDGRGLASCRNDAGIVTEIPVTAEAVAVVIAPIANSGELTFSASAIDPNAPNDLDVEIQGPEMKFSSTTKALQKLAVKSVTFHFDDSAPTLE